MEVARRATTAGGGEGGGGGFGSALLSARNSEVLAAELCRMRGAALKLGQVCLAGYVGCVMLSAHSLATSA